MAPLSVWKEIIMPRPEPKRPSLSKSIKATCIECSHTDDVGSNLVQIRDCCGTGCHLYPVRPLPKTSPNRGRLPLRASIDAHCKSCVYDEGKKGAGTWRKQCQECTITTCPIYPVRPIPFNEDKEES